MATNKWSEEETILAFYYYCCIPFGKIHTRNPEIVRIANIVGRTPGAVVFKMGNLAHFDPEQQKRNVSGFSNGSKLDELIVKSFLDDWEALAIRAQEIERHFVLLQNGSALVSDDYKTQETEKVQIVPQRIDQQFFRHAVLSAYSNRCCITGLEHPELLIASHIKPWSVCDAKRERANPTNGLCLNALHSQAFERGLLTVLPDYHILVSSKLDGNDDGALWLKQCNGTQIHLPDKFIPQKAFLEYHNDVVFQG